MTQNEEIEYRILTEFRHKHQNQEFSGYCHEEEYIKMFNRDNDYILRVETLICGKNICKWFFGIYLIRDNQKYSQYKNNWLNGIVDTFWLYGYLISNSSKLKRNQILKAFRECIVSAFITDEGNIDKYPIYHQIETLYYKLNEDMSPVDKDNVQSIVNQYSEQFIKMLDNFYALLLESSKECLKSELQTVFIEPYLNNK